MKRLLLSFLVLFKMQNAMAAEKSCASIIQGYNIYEVLVKGQVQERFSIFEIQDWSRQSTFQGLITKVKADTIKIHVVLGEKITKESNYELKLTPWRVDSKYSEALGFDGKKFFSEWTSGTFTVELLKAGQVLCKSPFKILPPH